MQQGSADLDSPEQAAMRIAPPPSSHSRKPRRLVLALGTLAVAAVMAGTGFSLWRTQQEVIARAEEHLRGVAQILGEQALRSTQAIDIILAGAADDAQRAARKGRIVPSQALHGHLRDTVAPAPYVRALALMDANGDLTMYTPQFPAPSGNYSDREYFQAHFASRDRGLRLSPPLRSRISRQLTIPISRRIDDATGRFLGVVLADVDPSYYLGPQGLDEFGPDGVVRMLRGDGTLLTGYPMALAAAGGNYRGFALQGVRPGHAQIAQMTGKDSAGRISAIYALQEYPLVITVTSSRDFILQEWRRGAWLFGAMAAAAALILAVMTWRLAHQLRLDEELKAMVAQSQERLQAIIQSAMDAIITLDAGRRIVLFNAAAEQTFRCPSAQAIGADIGRFIPGLLPQGQRPGASPAGDGGIAEGNMGEHLSLTGVRADGEQFPVDASISQALLRGAELFIVILRDVTERKLAEAALQENEKRYRTLFSKATDGILLLDTQGNIVEVNDSFARMHGYTVDELLQMNLRDLDTPESLALAPARIRRVLDGESLGFELEQYHKDGHIVPIDVAASGIEIDGEHFILAFHRDITERKRAEQDIRRSQQELRGLSKAAHEAIEAERRRTARELHDELGQSLTALKMDLESMRTALPPSQPDLEKRARGMHTLLDGTIAATRRIAADLRPLMLDDLGLAAALDWLTHNFSQHSGIATDLVIDDSVAQVGEPVASALYRITQESLTNVAKYAQATTAEIRLERDGDWVQLSVRDNGRGIDAADQGKRGAFGLVGIRERVTLLGGEVAISGQPGHGSEVRARIPLTAVDAGGALA